VQSLSLPGRGANIGQCPAVSSAAHIGALSLKIIFCSRVSLTSICAAYSQEEAKLWISNRRFEDVMC